MKLTTLCFVIDENKKSLLMIFKKKGQGEGKWNVPGGKLKNNETEEQAAIRECIEETGITPISLQKKGVLEFLFPEGGSWSNRSSVFITNQFKGVLIQETEECSASWIGLDKIPYEKMWEDDKLWIPSLLAGENINKRFIFRKDNSLEREEDL